MSIKRSLIKNTGFNLAGYAYLLVASFFSISVILNNLGGDIFGVYLLLASVIPLASVFDFGISNAVIRKLSLPSTTSEEKVRTWKTSFAIFAFLAVVLSALVFFILWYLSHSMPIFKHVNGGTLEVSTLILASIVFVNHLNTHFLSLPQANQRFDIFNSKTLLVGTANTIISAIISGYFPNIAIIFGVQLIFHVLTLVFIAIYSLRFFPGQNFLPKYESSTGRELFSFGVKNFVGTLAGQVENQFSNFILGALVSARAITAFSIPQSVVAKGAGVVSQFAQAFFPLSASLLEKDRIKKLRSLVIGAQSLTLLGGFIAVVLSHTIGEPFLYWWLKDESVVITAYPVLKILSFYFVLVSLTPVPTALLQGLNRPQIPSFFGVLTVAIEIGLSLILVPIYGPVGMAYSFLISVCFTVPGILIVTWIQLESKIASLNNPAN